MRSKGHLGGWLSACAVAILAFAPTARARVDVPASPDHWVIDKAGVFDHQPALRQKLESLLAELNEETTDQIKVLTVPSTEGEDIFTFAERTAERWRLGQKKKDNGALIVLDVNDHRVRIHTYYGLEGALPDQWIGTLSRRIATQYFREGRYAEGLYQMTVEVVNKVTKESGVKLDNMPRPARDTGSNYPILIVFAVMALVFWLSWRSQRRMRHRRYWSGPWRGAYWGPSWSSGGSWSGGGSSWGGSFGGGGGSFGGGSALGGGGMTGGGGGGASW